MNAEMVLNTTTALQSYKFAMQMEERVKFIDPDLNISIYGVSELFAMQQSKLFQQQSLKLPARYLNIPENSSILKTKSGQAATYIGGKGIKTFLAINTELENPKDLFDIIYDEISMPKETLLDGENQIFDLRQFNADHEIFHAALHKKIYDRVGTTKFSSDPQYQKFLHESGADIFALMSAINDGAEPQKTMDTLALYRSLNTLKRGDHKHFTTPVIQAYAEDILENTETLKTKTKSELLEETVGMVMGSMENPEDLTEDSIFSALEYENMRNLMQETKACLGDYQGGVPIKDKFDYSPAELVDLAKIIEDDSFREYVDTYIEPYAYVLEPEISTDLEIDDGLRGR